MGSLLGGYDFKEGTARLELSSASLDERGLMTEEAERRRGRES